MHPYIPPLLVLVTKLYTTRYIEDLVSENQQLRRSSSSRPANEESAATLPNGPGFAEAPWFVNADALHTPILIAEASDSAFATRFRQAMSNGQHGHILRVNFLSDEQLLALSDADVPWPTPARARLLVRAAINSICRCYYIVRRSSILHELEYAIQNSSQIGLRSKNKLWVMFAIGEMYTTRNLASERGFPGLHYFCKAMNILRVVSERPSVDIVETQMLLVCSLSPPLAWLDSPADHLVVVFAVPEPKAYRVQFSWCCCATGNDNGAATQHP